MRRVTAAADHLRMTSWNVIVVVIFVLFLLLATLMVTNPLQGRGAVGGPPPEQTHTSAIQRDSLQVVLVQQVLVTS